MCLVYIVGSTVQTSRAKPRPLSALAKEMSELFVDGLARMLNLADLASMRTISLSIRPRTFSSILSDTDERAAGSERRKFMTSGWIDSNCC